MRRLPSALSGSAFVQALKKTRSKLQAVVDLEREKQIIRYALKKKPYYLGIFPNMGGGVFPNPKTFVNLPSIFLYAKFILRC